MKFDSSQLLLYAVTDRAWTGKKTLYEQVEEALKAGITLLQLREKQMEEKEFLEEAIRMKELSSRYHIPLIINDNVNIALQADADGVHVGQDDWEAAKVRKLIGKDKILGVTVKTVAQVKAAMEQGADYLGAGAVFGSATKKDARHMDYQTLKDICRSASIPVAAIGGINASNIMELKGSGVCGAAVVSAVFGAEDIGRAVRELYNKSKEMAAHI